MTLVASAKLKSDELLITWLSLGETRNMLEGLIRDISLGIPIRDSSVAKEPVHIPHARPQSPMSPRNIKSPSSANFTSKSPSKSPMRGLSSSDLISKEIPIVATGENIPVFYFPNGKQMSESERKTHEKTVSVAFQAATGGKNVANVEQMTSLVRGQCALPGFFTKRIMEKITGGKNATGVNMTQFVSWWIAHMAGKDQAARTFYVLLPDDAKLGPKAFLTKKDFVWMMEEIVRSHPGLEFLQATPEFQERYKETVIIRIFYAVNLRGDGKITLAEMRKSSFVATCKFLDEEPEINKVTDLFSYEHFYVLYCKFWELDTEHDYLIDKEDLLRYANYALTYRVVDRIFNQIPRKLSSGDPTKMSYEDFCWFLLSEEDKSTPQAIKYWFRCIDLDGNGAIDRTELKYFYQEQLHRMECVSQEVVSFEDVCCQLHDMIHPEKEGFFTLRDLIKSPHASNFFNILINLNKFIAFEQRDPFQMRQEALSGLTDWERFARVEYDHMAMEDEQNDENDDNGGGSGGGGGGGGWDLDTMGMKNLKA